MPFRRALVPGKATELPEGFVYRPDFLSEDEERGLLERIAELEFGEVRMNGVAARRRVVHYGWLYSFTTFKVAPGPPIPYWLQPLRTRSAGAAGLDDPERLAEALVTEYSPGATIGWHRDAPPFGIVVAVSLASACRFRFRRGEGDARETVDMTVEPRSVYILDGPARTQWQHHIPPTKALRYSITFRTLRRASREPRMQ
jgi:alkylated DNA repair dioxygenase AlkB